MLELLTYARWLVCAALLAACGSSDGNAVATYVAPGAPFAGDRTFAVAAPADPDGEAPTDAVASLQAADSAASAQLSRRGLEQVRLDENPDLIWFSLASTNDPQARAFACLPGRFYGNWPFDFAPCTLARLYPRFEPQTLLVGLVDPQANQIVFAGEIPNVPEGSSAPGGRVFQGIAGVMSAYPAHAPSTDASTP